MKKNIKIIFAFFILVIPLLLSGCITTVIDEIITYTPEIPLTNMSAGEKYSMAVNEIGELYVWGINHDGLCKNNQDEILYKPEKITDLTEIKAVFGLHEHFAIITKDGDLYTWGYNHVDCLGHSETSAIVSIPTEVIALSSYDIVDVALGWSSTMCLTSNGDLFVWGYNHFESVENNHTPTKIFNTKIKDIASGKFHSIALDHNGSVYTRGSNTYGQLGFYSDPVRVMQPTKVFHLPQNIVSVYASEDRSFALTDDGELYAWGDNIFGQLGDGTKVDRTTPVKVLGLEGEKVIDVAAGFYHTLALTASNKVFAWGRNEAGALGNGSILDSTVPIEITALKNQEITDIHAGGWHSLALTSNGAIYTWGGNDSGQLGDGNGGQRQYCPYPVPVKF